MLSNIIYLVAIVLAGSITTAMAVHLWINRKIIEPDLSILLLAGLWLWITAQIGECLIAPLAVKIVLYKIKFTGISIVSVSWLGFCHQLVGGKKRFRLPLVFLLLVPGLVFNIFSFIPFFEALSWKRFFVSPNLLLLDVEYGAGYLVFNAYSLVLMVAGFARILLSLFRKPALIKLRLMPFLFGALLCAAAGLADFFFKPELNYYRFLPIGLSLCSLFVIYYIRLRYFRTIPLAQHTVVESMTDCLVIVSPENTVIYMNPAAYELFGIPQITIIGKRLDERLTALKEILERMDRADNRKTITTLKGRVFDVRISPIRNRGGRIVNRIIIFRDVTELKRTEESLREMKENLEIKVAERTKELARSNDALKKEIGERKKAEEIIKNALEEKSVLLGEVHHRVKNNLQVVSSLLKLQSHYIADQQTRELFEISVSRIRSIALVHEKLYRSEDINRTRILDYIKELVHSVLFSHSGNPDEYSLNFSIEPVFLDIDKSILIGLIVNELVINSLKHAFKTFDNRRGEVKKEIFVEFKQEGGDYVLLVADNGPGMPADFDLADTPTLGMKIITTLVRQLKGELEIVNAKGNRVRVRFPVSPA